MSGNKDEGKPRRWRSEEIKVVRHYEHDEAAVEEVIRYFLERRKALGLPHRAPQEPTD